MKFSDDRSGRVESGLAGVSTAARMVAVGVLLSLAGLALAAVSDVGYLLSGAGGMLVFAGLIGVAVNGR